MRLHENALSALHCDLCLYASRHKKKLSIENGEWRHLRQHPVGEIFISGSSQPGPADFRELLLNPKFNIQIVVDLREEPHFFLLDDAKKYHRVTYTNRKNWPFPGIALEKLFKKESKQLGKLLERMAYYQQENGYISSEKVQIKSLAVESEQATIESINLMRKQKGLSPVQYYRVPVTDKMPPKPRDVDQLVKISLEAKTEGKNIHYHCMAGKGRTTTAMVITDIICGIPLEQAIKLENSKLGRNLKSVPREDAEDPRVVRGAALRLGLLYRFEAYWTGPDHDKITFEEYMEKHPMDKAYEKKMAAKLRIED